MTMLSSGKSVVRVKNVLGDDVYGLWHVKKIVVQKGRQRYAIIPHKKETFSTKDDAVHYAQLRTRRFVERTLGETKAHRLQFKPVMKYVFAAALLPLMMTAAMRWFRGYDRMVTMP